MVGEDSADGHGAHERPHVCVPRTSRVWDGASAGRGAVRRRKGGEGGKGGKGGEVGGEGDRGGDTQRACGVAAESDEAEGRGDGRGELEECKGRALLGVVAPEDLRDQGHAATLPRGHAATVEHKARERRQPR